MGIVSLVFVGIAPGVGGWGNVGRVSSIGSNVSSNGNGDDAWFSPMLQRRRRPSGEQWFCKVAI